MGLFRPFGGFGHASGRPGFLIFQLPCSEKGEVEALRVFYGIDLKRCFQLYYYEMPRKEYEGRQKVLPQKNYLIPALPFEAVIFDLDGVVTDTASVPAAAWKKMFDDFLSRYSTQLGVPFRPFDPDRDYRLSIDGKPRFEGIRSFLASKGIKLPEGSSKDPPGSETIHGLGNLKNEYFQEEIRKQGTKVYPSTVDLIHNLKSTGSKQASFLQAKIAP